MQKKKRKKEFYATESKVIFAKRTEILLLLHFSIQVLGPPHKSYPDILGHSQIFRPETYCFM